MKFGLAFRALAVMMIVAALSTTGFAQRPSGGGAEMGNRRGPSVIGLIARKDVQRDLKMTAAQVKSITSLQDQMMKEMRRDPGAPRDGNRSSMREKMDGFEKRANGLLTPAQRTRIKEIQLHLMGNRVITMPEMQKQLGITAVQKARIDAAVKAHGATLSKLMQSFRTNKQRGGTIQAPGAFQKIEAANTKLDRDLGAIMTAAQRTKLASLRGRPFKADPPQRPQMGGRPQSGTQRRG